MLAEAELEKQFGANMNQEHQKTCAVRCLNFIMRDYGMQIPPYELCDLAERQVWYNDGTPNAIRDLLDTCGIETHAGFRNTVFDLINELQQGHRVVVEVDADELWAEPGSKEWEFYHQIDNANHALIVAGMKVDIENPAKVTITLTDSGNENLFIEYPMNHVALALKDSDFYMMASNEPAPYQYNELTNKIEFFNFATNYIVSDFPFHNEFSDIYDLVETNVADYEPYYAEGYLYNITDGVSHDNFVKYYKINDTTSLRDLFNLEHIDDSRQQISLNNNDIIISKEASLNMHDLNALFDQTEKTYSVAFSWSVSVFGWLAGLSTSLFAGIIAGVIVTFIWIFGDDDDLEDEDSEEIEFDRYMNSKLDENHLIKVIKGVYNKKTDELLTETQIEISNTISVDVKEQMGRNRFAELEFDCDKLL